MTNPSRPASCRPLRTRLRSAAWLLAPVLLLLAAPSLQAQGTTTAEGIVLDAEGNPVPGVEVLMNYKGHIIQKYKTKTDKKGKFVHVNVFGGVYDITMKHPQLGEATFKDFTVRDLVSTEKLPVFRLGIKKAAAAPTAEPDPQADPQAAAATAAAIAAAKLAGAVAVDFDAANAAFKAGNLDAAIAGYEKVAAAAPDLAEVHQNLGLALVRKGDKARAETALRRAVELKPELVNANRALSILLYDSGKRDEGMAFAQKAADLAADNAGLQYNLGVMLANAGKSAEAKAALLKAETIDPKHAEVQYQLGTLAVAANDKADAIARLEKYVGMAPADAPNVASAKAIMAALKK